MEITRCFKCEGKGKIRKPVDWLMGFLSGGLSALMDLSDWETCSACKGKGYIQVKSEHEKD